jgi:hypothetical protein
MSLPPNLALVSAITYKYLFCLSLSEWLQPPARWKAQGLLSGSCPPGTVGPKNLDTTSSIQCQMAGEPYTP